MIPAQARNFRPNAMRDSDILIIVCAMDNNISDIPTEIVIITVTTMIVSSSGEKKCPVTIPQLKYAQIPPAKHDKGITKYKDGK